MYKPKKYTYGYSNVIAIQYDGTRECLDAICKWANVYREPDDDMWVDYITFKGEHMDILVSTVYGHEQLEVLDWVIKTEKDEFFPCNSSLFSMLYEQT